MHITFLPLVHTAEAPLETHHPLRVSRLCWRRMQLSTLRGLLVAATTQARSQTAPISGTEPRPVGVPWLLVVRTRAICIAHAAVATVAISTATATSGATECTWPT